MSNGRSLRYLATSLLLLLTTGSLFASTAFANPSNFDWAISVVTDPLDFSRELSLAPGEFATLYVVGDRLTPEAGVGLRAIQFAVEVDPRLVVLSRNPEADAGVVLNRGPDEWLLGFTDCVFDASESYVLMSYLVTLPIGATDTLDIVVDVGPLASTGEPLAYTSCVGGTLQLPLKNGGRSVINPTPGRILNFLGSESTMVEGRGAHLVWQTHAASAVSLDGSLVATSGESIVSPTVQTLYRLESTASGVVESAEWSIDVIRVPRIDHFTVEEFLQNGQPTAAIRWETTGANSVLLLETGLPLAERGVLIVDLVAPPRWTLMATNEWGSSQQLASLVPSEVPPAILEFAANPNPFVPGEAVQLVYSLFGADAATLEPGIGTVDPLAGEITVFPSNTTNYTITATNANGSVSQEIVVQVVPPRIDSFVADPPVVYAGRSTTLRWSVGPGVDLVITPDVGPVTGESGSVVVEAPADGVVYTLTASNIAGSVSADVRIGWSVPLVALTTSDSEPYAIDTIELNAIILGADEARLDPGFGPIDPAGERISTTVEQLTTFVLTASNAKGSATASVVVTPKPPVVAITASDINPWPFDPIDLHLSIEGAASATLEPGIGAIDPTDTVINVLVEQATTFVLTASNARGSVTASVVVTPKPPVVAIAASDLNPWPFDPIDLILSIEGAASATLEPGIGAIDPTDTVINVLVEQTTTFVLTATNAAGTVASEATVQPKLPSAQLSAAPLAPAFGELVEFTVVLEGANSASLDPLFGPIPVEGGVFSSVIDDSTTVILTATNGAGSVTRQLTIVPIDPVAPTILDFSADQPWVEYDGAVQLSWDVQGAETITIEPGGVSSAQPAGSVSLFPSQDTTTYTLLATNRFGSALAQVEVKRRPFRIVSFTASPPVVNPGESSILSWEVVGTADVSIDWVHDQPLSGSISVQPASTTNYILRAVNSDAEFWSETAALTVVVSFVETPTLALSWKPDRVQSYPDANLAAFEPFHFYALALNPPVGVLAYEFALDFRFPSCLFTLGVVYNPPESINVAPYPDNFIVGTTECLFAAPVVRLVRMTFLATTPGCLLLGGAFNVTGSDPSTFGGQSPGMLTCLESLVPFTPGPSFWLFNSIVSTVTLDLQLRELPTGLEATWKTPEEKDLDSLRILRAADDGLPRELLKLSGNAARARGSYVDADARPGVRYRYRVVVEADGVSYSSEEVEAVRSQVDRTTVRRSRLLGNVPNPFNPQTEIRFELARDGSPRLEIFDSAGRRVRSVQLGPMTAGGVQSWMWNGKDEGGLEVSSGVYHVRLTAGSHVDSRSISLIR